MSGIKSKLARGICIVAAALPMAATPLTSKAQTESPVRWVTGGAVWSTSQEAFNTFLDTGKIEDRGLNGGINLSGWNASQIRDGMNKNYAVNLLGVANFLYSSEGEQYLKLQTRSYVPYWLLSDGAVLALRSAIIADAVDGSISSRGIMANLPVDFRLNDSGEYDGKQNVWQASGCQGDRQCSSLLSWYVFLPASIQANQKSSWLSQLSSSAIQTTPGQKPVKALW